MSAQDVTAPLRSAEEATPAAPAAAAPLAQGLVLGRYVVLSRLGSGGAGSVYAAYDTQIDRRVALKVLHATEADDTATWSRRWDRIVREARILGKLSHPNVVTLYDVDTIDDVSFIAMELVPGTDLAGWTATRRPWRDVVEIMLQAARGLAAAHEAGIVHGDFKPANVLLGGDQRARVSDFGVARVDDEHPAGGSGDGAGETTDQGTTVGRIAGTPYYMAPEQHEGRPPDARADVYAFGVALHEALYGARPFRGKTVTALALEKRSGPPRPPGDTRDVPSWLRDVVARALAPEPEGRFASMRAVIAALDRPRSGRRRLLSMGALAIGLAAFGGVAWLQAAAERPCSGAARHLQGVWDPTRAGEVEAALVGSATPYAADAWSSVRAGLDAYAQGWVAAHEEACRATHLGEQSTAALDLRMRCLDQQRRRLVALVDVLAEPADAAVVRSAPDSVSSLAPVSRGADVERLAAGPQPPDDPRVARIEAEIDRSSAYGAVGRFPDARAASERAAEIAEALDFPPLVAETLLELGSTQPHTGQADLAEQTLERAYYLAQRSRHDEVAATASLWLTRAKRQHRAGGPRSHATGPRDARGRGTERDADAPNRSARLRLRCPRVSHRAARRPTPGPVRRPAVDTPAGGATCPRGPVGAAHKLPFREAGALLPPCE